MTKPKHTPGPWHLGLKQAEQIVYDESGWAIANATVYHARKDVEECKANARLIAAAPEMLGLIKLLMNEFAEIVDRPEATADAEHYKRCLSLLLNAQETIAKATGDSEE